MINNNHGFSTKLIHGGDIDDQFHSATVPIYQTSTFAFDSAEEGARCFAGESNGYIYTRIGNPTINALERQLASLENGFGAIAVSSGMAAANVIYFSLLSSGDHVVSTDAIYGPSRSIMENQYIRMGISATYINTTDVERIKAAIQPNTKMLYIESPANPTMDITDLRACAEIAKEHNLVFVVDNTFSNPYLQNPLDLGADIVFHSMTKSINGHADIVAGAIITKTEAMYKKLRPMMIALGYNMDPTQAYMVMRGLKTLAIRTERSQENAIVMADFLEKHPKVAWIKFPGLKSHPQFELAQSQMRGPGSMISFGLTTGYEGAKKLLDNVHLALLAVSLGGVETLIQHPASMTHAKVSKEGKDKAGITDDLVRFSVGIENVEDIMADIAHALDQV